MKTKIVALKNNEDFKNLIKGKKLSNKYFVMFYKKLLNKKSNYFNISIVTKKKLGNAIERNLTRRRIKNILNELVKKISLNFDYSYLIIPKDKALKKNSFFDLKKIYLLNLRKNCVHGVCKILRICAWNIKYFYQKKIEK